MKEKIIDCSQYKKLYKVKGKLVNGGFFKSYASFEGLVMAYGSPYAISKIEQDKESPIHSILLNANGELDINPSFTLSSFEVATDKDYNLFLKALKKKNFSFELVTRERVIGLYEEVLEKNIEWQLRFKDPKKVKFLYGNTFVDRKTIENLELPNGQSFLLYFDNGYSYMSTDPVSKEKFLSYVDKLLADSFTWSRNGITIVCQDNEYGVNCLIGKNKHWSEISDS